MGSAPKRTDKRCRLSLHSERKAGAEAPPIHLALPCLAAPCRAQPCPAWPCRVMLLHRLTHCCQWARRCCQPSPRLALPSRARPRPALPRRAPPGGASRTGKRFPACRYEVALALPCLAKPSPARPRPASPSLAKPRRVMLLFVEQAHQPSGPGARYARGFHLFCPLPFF